MPRAEPGLPRHRGSYYHLPELRGLLYLMPFPHYNVNYMPELQSYVLDFDLYGDGIVPAGCGPPSNTTLHQPLSPDSMCKAQPDTSSGILLFVRYGVTGIYASP